MLCKTISYVAQYSHMLCKNYVYVVLQLHNISILSNIFHMLSNFFHMLSKDCNTIICCVKKLDMLCKIRQHMNCNVGPRTHEYWLNVDQTQTFAYAEIQSNEEQNKIHIHNSRLILDFDISLVMSRMWSTIMICYDLSHVSIFVTFIHVCISILSLSGLNARYMMKTICT